VRQGKSTAFREVEVVEVLCERQLGDGELVLDRACLLLADFGLEQVAAAE